MTFLRKYLEQCDTRYQQPTQPCALQGGRCAAVFTFTPLVGLRFAVYSSLFAQKKNASEEAL